jgi:SAM-dependent methyltransferase
VRTDFNLTGSVRGLYRVVECLRCRFRYLHPRPAPTELAAFYGPGYPAHALQLRREESGSSEQASVNRRLIRMAGQRLGLLRRFLPLPWTGLHVLDVGCGSGAFLLELAQRHAVEAWGLDIAPAALADLALLDETAGARLRLVEGELVTADLPAGYFDLITLWHVLEHDGDPVAALGRARDLLRRGAWLVAEVPNSGGLIARLCGRYWLGWDLPRHLVHFTPFTLRQVARRAGLTDVRVLREYTLNPLCLSPLLASLAIWKRQRKGRTYLKRVAYRRWDGLADLGLRLVNGMERLIGGNGLVLVARAPSPNGPACRRRQEDPPCATSSR